jgi:hypothetical protein
MDNRIAYAAKSHSIAAERLPIALRNNSPRSDTPHAHTDLDFALHRPRRLR